MKISIITHKQTGAISRVESFDRYNKSEEDVMKAVEEFNSNDSNLIKYNVIDLEDGSLLQEAIKFLLGDGKYKSQITLRRLAEDIKELRDNIEDLGCDICDMKGDVERVAEQTKKFLTEE